jgi:hypothetical protein
VSEPNQEKAQTYNAAVFVVGYLRGLLIRDHREQWSEELTVEVAQDLKSFTMGLPGGQRVKVSVEKVA